MAPQQPLDGISLAIGLAACGVSSVFFGSMFVPIRKYDAGDGIFVQWVISYGILAIGFIVFGMLGFPGFFPLAMLGGAFWAIGNATAVPIISRLGLTVGVLIWNTTNCLTGWAGGRFGLFGMKANLPASQILNYGGLVCVIIGTLDETTTKVAQSSSPLSCPGVITFGILFSRIKSETSTSKKDETHVEKDKSDSGTDTERLTHEETTSTEESERERKYSERNDGAKDKDTDTDGKQRIIGIAMALAAGVFYGMTFVPVIVMMENPDKFPNYPDDGLAYVFSHYVGIFVTASVIFVGYAAIKRGRLFIPTFIILPSLLAGLLWGIAQASFFIANQHLSQAVTFPIITMLPGCVVSAWSILYFHEIKGSRNFRILAIAMLVTLSGVVMVGMSKFIYL